MTSRAELLPNLRDYLEPMLKRVLETGAVRKNPDSKCEQQRDEMPEPGRFRVDLGKKDGRSRLG